MKELKFIRLMLLTLCVAGIGISVCNAHAGKNALPLDKGVIINGVRWATRNVASPGTFAASPEASGLFYQWNSKVGWSSTNPLTPSDGTSSWNSSWNGGFTTASDSDTWTIANDPSPTGYRMPTLAEIKTLLDTAKVTSTRTTQNFISGRKFTDRVSGNSIFLPASGYRYGYVGGTLYNVGSLGFYWSSSAFVSDAYHLNFDSVTADWNYYPRAYGFTVRPVAE